MDSELLKVCPITTIRFYPAKYNIENPTDFETIVNSLDPKKLKTLDFIPFLRKRSMEQIKSFCVYHLVGKIKVLNDSPPHSLKHLSSISSSSSSTFKHISAGLDQGDIDSIDGMITNVILDLTIHNMIRSEGKQNKIKSIPAIPSNELYLYKRYSSQYESLIVPVNVVNAHWVLIVFEFQEKQLHILDPYPTPILTLEEGFVRELKSNNWKIDTHSYGLHKKQELNSVDCGVFVILYAKSFILHNNFHEGDVAEIRGYLTKTFG